MSGPDGIGSRPSTPPSGGLVRGVLLYLALAASVYVACPCANACVGFLTTVSSFPRSSMTFTATCRFSGLERRALRSGQVVPDGLVVVAPQRLPKVAPRARAREDEVAPALTRTA